MTQVVNMKDLVPWSLIYGIQNDNHLNDISFIQEKLNSRTRQLAIMIVDKIIGTSTYNFNRFSSSDWENWNNNIDIITIADIDIATTNHIALIDKEYGFICESTHKEIRARTAILKELWNKHYNVL